MAYFAINAMNLKNIKEIDDMGNIMRIYYKTPDLLIDAVNKKKKPTHKREATQEKNEVKMALY